MIAVSGSGCVDEAIFEASGAACHGQNNMSSTPIDLNQIVHDLHDDIHDDDELEVDNESKSPRLRAKFTAFGVNEWRLPELC